MEGAFGNVDRDGLGVTDHDTMHPAVLRVMEARWRCDSSSPCDSDSEGLLWERIESRLTGMYIE
jgi:hypothetical protein